MEIVDISNKRFYREYIYPKFAFFKRLDSLFYYFLILIGVGILFYGYALITNNFVTSYSGDYGQQGVPFAYNFYDTWWTFFKSFDFPNWNSSIFLGADNIEANTFYGLFSPFTFILLFFPREWLAQVMTIENIARLVVAALIFRVYLKSLGVKENTSRVFAIAYAFMGWTAYNLWFNSFAEVVTFFPLILLGVERVIKNKSIWPLALGFFFLGISNYFFFLCGGIFALLYAAFRYFYTFKTRNKKDNVQVLLLGFLAAICGVFMSAPVTLPSILASFSIERAQTSTYWSDLVYSITNNDWDAALTQMFFYWDGTGSGYRAFYPVVSFLYPAMSDRFVNIVRDQYFDNFGSSIYIFTPGIILLFISMYTSFKERKISHFVVIGLLSLSVFIPFFYYLCGFFSIGYGRWEIVIPTCALAYIAVQFDKRETIKIPRYIVVISGVLAMALMIGAYFYSIYLDMAYSRVENYSEMVYLVIYEVILTAITTGLLTSFWKSVRIRKVISIIFAFEILVMGTLVANVHSITNYNNTLLGGHNNFVNETLVINNIKENDDSYYRIQSAQAYSSNANNPMAHSYNGASTFHTFYNNNVDDFQRMSHILKNDTTWIGNAYEKRINLDSFLGVKYYILKESDFTKYYTDGTSRMFTPNVPLGYTRIDDPDDGDGFQVYQNDHHINFATSYSTLYYKGECSDSYYNNFHTSGNHNYDVIRNEETYLTGAILNGDDLTKISTQYNGVFDIQTSAPSRQMSSVPVTKQYYDAGANFNSLTPLTGLDTDPINSSAAASLVSDGFASHVRIVIRPMTSDGYFPIGENGAYYLISYSMDHTATIYLIDENDQVYMYDDFRNNDANSSKRLRGFYPTQRFKMIIIQPSGDGIDTSTSNLVFYEDIDDTFDRIDTAASYQVDNVVAGIDKFTFESNYSETRYVITQVAYHDGWKVTAKDDQGNSYDVEIYNSQGGFVGFVTPTTGKIYYEMTYSTPRFTLGVVSFLFSTAVMTGVSIGVEINERKKRNRLLKVN